MTSAAMEARHNRHAIVIGGSIAGLFVGAFLRRIGWQVDIYERSSIELIGRGVGIVASHLELDGRSATARRFRDLVNAFVAPTWAASIAARRSSLG